MFLWTFLQEQAAKSHGIFNQDSTGIGASFGSKEDGSGLLAGCHIADLEVVLCVLVGFCSRI